MASSPMDRASLMQPASVMQFLRFITGLHIKGLLVSTIQSKLAALGYLHQLHGWFNPTDHFIVHKCLLGALNLASHQPHLRGPVTPQLLAAIVAAVEELVTSPYEQILLRAIFLLAFFAFLRLGEYTASLRNLSWDDITLMRSAIKLRFTSFFQVLSGASGRDFITGYQFSYVPGKGYPTLQEAVARSCRFLFCG